MHGGLPVEAPHYSVTCPRPWLSPHQPHPAPRGGFMCVSAYIAVMGFLRIKMPGYLVSSHDFAE
jgi:hypothetical protein